MTETQTLEIKRQATDFPIAQLDNPAWNNARAVRISKYWSGKNAPRSRHAEARLLWSDDYLYVRFVVNQAEPLVVSDRPNLASKTKGLWDRDVAEIFIAPDRGEPRKYFEFEIAPNGEWIDLGIDLTSGERVTDWDYRSGMESAARIDKGRVVMAIRVPWRSIGNAPQAGAIWAGNLYRCVGRDPDRGYLAWSPTMTEEPNFHVPERFGEFHFVK